MKKIITVFALFITTLSMAQLTVKDVKDPEVIGEYKTMGVLFGKLEKKDADTYEFTYKDIKFKTVATYKSFEFQASDLDALHQILTQTEGINAGEEKEVDLGNGHVLNIVYKKSMGKIWSMVYHTYLGVTGEFSFQPKHYNKMFGK